MQDEHFIRQWNDVHEDFTTDLHAALTPLTGATRNDAGKRRHIEQPYDSRVRKPLSPAAMASLRGLAASVITAALWVTVMLAATPAPGLASPHDAPAIAAHACMVHPLIA